MYASTVDEAAGRLRELRSQAREDVVLAAVALALAVMAAELQPELALPLFVGGLVVGALGIRALWRRWDLVDRLAGERDAYVIPEVLTYAARETTQGRRHTFAVLLRTTMMDPGAALAPRVRAAAEELDALATDLDDPSLALDPCCGVACLRLLSDLESSPLLNPDLPAEDLRARVFQIRRGFMPRPGSS